MIQKLTCLMLCASGLVFGQAEASPRFEVASIRPSNAEAGSSGIDSGNGRITAKNVTLKRCIMGAYKVGPNQVLGGPDWLERDRFEIVARAEQRAGDGIMMTMLQNLLAERFKLALHRETKPIEAYVLEIAKNGPKLEKGNGDSHKTSSGRGTIVASNASMDRFAEVLSRQMDLPVVNHTGLEGVFNFKLEWNPESGKAPNGADSPAVERPAIFTALQEQLGLRLRVQKVPIEVLVIDHAERPSEN